MRKIFLAALGLVLLPHATTSEPARKPIACVLAKQIRIEKGSVVPGSARTIVACLGPEGWIIL